MADSDDFPPVDIENMEEDQNYSDTESFHITRKQTTIEREAEKRREVAQEYVKQLPPEISNLKEYLPSQLSGALFCGHLVTDLDSIAGAIGAAELYGGTPARAPWGSMSSIITHNFLTLRRRPKRSTAGMLLCAILSDTLNLQSPTTTEWDRLMVAILVQLLEVADVQYLASQQFKAKSSELGGLSARSLVTGDQKVFTYKTDLFDGAVAFAVVETTDDEVILRKAPELLVALSEDKEQTGVSLTYLAVVNIVELKTHLLICGPSERSLAQAAFPHGTFVLAPDQSEPYLMNLGKLVSRKKDFIPAVSAAVKKGWFDAPAGKIHSSQSDIFDFSKYKDSALTLRPFEGNK
eukprot:gene3442-3668_t